MTYTTLNKCNDKQEARLIYLLSSILTAALITDHYDVPANPNPTTMFVSFLFDFSIRLGNKVKDITALSEKTFTQK